MFMIIIERINAMPPLNTSSPLIPASCWCSPFLSAFRSSPLLAPYHLYPQLHFARIISC